MALEPHNYEKSNAGYYGHRQTDRNHFIWRFNVQPAFTVRNTDRKGSVVQVEAHSTCQIIMIRLLYTSILPQGDVTNIL